MSRPYAHIDGMDNTPVFIDPERLFDLSSEYRAEHPGNAGSERFSTLARRAGYLPVAALEGRTPLPRWKVESLAVLIQCLPTAIINDRADAPEAKEETVKPRIKWTPEMDATLRKEAPNGYQAVADALNLSVSSVYRRAGKLGVQFGSKKKAADGYQPKGDPKPVNPPKGKGTHVASPPIVAPATTDDMSPERERELFVAPEPVAHEHYCSDIDECRSDFAHTPCGADPCELVADEAKATKTVHECTRDEHAAKHSRKGRITVDVHVHDLPAVKHALARAAAVNRILADRVLQLESYRTLPLHLRVRDAVATQQFPYELDRLAVLDWADERAIRSEAADLIARVKDAKPETVAAIRELLDAEAGDAA